MDYAGAARVAAEKVALWRWRPGNDKAAQKRLVYAMAYALAVLEKGVRPDVRHFEWGKHAYLAVGDGALPTYMTDFMWAYLRFDKGVTDTYPGPEVGRSSLVDDEFEFETEGYGPVRALWSAIAAELDGMGGGDEIDVDDPNIAEDVLRYAAEVRARDKGDAFMLAIQPDIDLLSAELVYSLLPAEVRGRLRYLHMDYGA